MDSKDHHEQPQGGQQAEPSEEDQIKGIFMLVQHILTEAFPDYQVEGEIAEHPIFGNLFAYQITKDEHSYACGFLMSEVIQKLQTNPNPTMWLSSFFHDMIDSGEARPFPAPPGTEEEAKQLVDQVLVPGIASTVRGEFAPEPIHIDLELHEEYGPILEAGVPAIKDGNNTCAVPLSFLYTLHHMNRDPSEPVVNAIYRLLEEHRTVQTQ